MITKGVRQTPTQLRKRYLLKLRGDQERLFKYRKSRNRIVNQQYHRRIAKLSPEELADRKARLHEYYINFVKPRRAKKCVTLTDIKKEDAEGTESTEADDPKPLWNPALC